MSESKHTPGPWMAIDLRHQRGGQIKIDSEHPTTDHIANVLARNENAEANAILIAAAPDMLEALEATVKELEYRASQLSLNQRDDAEVSRLDSILRQARAAIAKARR